MFFSQGVDLSSPNTINVPRVLNLTRPVESLSIALSFRVVTSAAIVALSPEAPQSLLQLIQVQGIHRKFGALTPIMLSGPTAFAWPRLFQSIGNDLLIDGTRAPDPGRPFVSPFPAAAGSHDVFIAYNIPVTPLMGIGQSIKRQAPFYFWHPQDWSDSIQIQLNFGDKSAFGDTTGSTFTFTSFGSATGLPQVQIHANYGLLGQLQNVVSQQSGVVIRNEQMFSNFTASAQNQRITTLQKQITTGLVLKTGTLQTVAQTAGVRSFASLSDLQFDVTQVVVDNKPVRNNQSNLVTKDFYGRALNTVHPQGYLLQTFVDGQNALLSYRGDGLPAGSTFELISNVQTSGAAQRQTLTQEMIFGGPFPALRP